MPNFQPGSYSIDGTISSVAVVDPATAPSNIIDRKSSWSVEVNVSISGTGVPLTGGHRWKVQAFIESMGPEFEGQAGADGFNTIPPFVTQPYDFSVTIPCGTALAKGINPGVYKLVVVVTLVTAANTPLGVAGFEEGPFIQFFDSP